jgi:hypothetical protein
MLLIPAEVLIAPFQHELKPPARGRRGLTCVATFVCEGRPQASASIARGTAPGMVYGNTRNPNPAVGAAVAPRPNRVIP